MPRNLSTHEAFQAECLAQMGVVTWTHGAEGAQGVFYRSAQPWSMAHTGVVPAISSSAVSSFDSLVNSAPTQVEPVLNPEQKEASVANLRQQLNAAPEVLVEDLQPIEENTVDIEVAVAAESPTLPPRVHFAGYLLLDSLLIITELPLSFNDEVSLDKLALSLGKALLKRDIDSWNKAIFSWPGNLRNPHLLRRQDWQLGAFEQYLSNLLVHANEDLMLLLAGDQVVQFAQEFAQSHVIHSFKSACIASLPQMLRIPELRKDAWGIMQTSLFAEQK